MQSGEECSRGCVVIEWERWPCYQRHTLEEDVQGYQGLQGTDICGKDSSLTVAGQTKDTAHDEQAGARDD